MLRVIFSVLFVLWPLGGLSAQPILKGAGATFPSPLYYKWIDTSKKQHSARISYKEAGSSEGIRLLLARKVDFGATDIFLSESEMKRSPAPLVHIPTCIGAVAVIYNLSGYPDIRMTPDVLAEIFLGRITSWADPRISGMNRHLKLPAVPIAVVHRSEGSGTTYLLTDYLSKVSALWKKAVGAGKAVRWPVGFGVEENSGVADLVKRIPGSIGYVSLNYAIRKGLPSAWLMNRAGRFVKPTVQSASAAASVDLSRDARILFTNSNAPDGYPISGFTYILLFQEQAYKDRSKNKALALAHFLWWCIHEGQREAAPLHYAPLPPEAVSIAENLLRSLTYAGQPLLR